MRAPDKKIYGYTICHEVRCQGTIVSFLPFRMPTPNKLDFLLRQEAVPCWELDTPILCSFTGGVDKGSNPGDTMLNELKEEAGYIIDTIDDARIHILGQSYSIKCVDTQYFLYAIDVTNFPEDKMVDLHVESDLEQSSTNTWLSSDDLIDIQDPFVAQIFLRFMTKRYTK